VQRVVHLCAVLSESEGKNANVDADALKVAALLHDVAKHLEKGDDSVEHGGLGASMAQSFLESIGFEEEKNRLVCHAIRVHTHREEPTCLEAKILHDADFLDKLGAVGLATIFVKACLTNTSIEEVVAAYEQQNPERSYVGLHTRWLKNPHLYTETAQKMAAERNRIVSLFFRELKEQTTWDSSSA